MQIIYDYTLLFFFFSQGNVTIESTSSYKYLELNRYAFL